MPHPRALSGLKFSKALKVSLGPMLNEYNWSEVVGKCCIRGSTRSLLVKVERKNSLNKQAMSAPLIVFELLSISKHNNGRGFDEIT